MGRFFVAKPETPIGLAVSTIYSNSIEIEWRPGGLSDVLYYVVKYRLKKSSSVNDNSGYANNNVDDDYYDEYDDYNEDDGPLMDSDSKFEVLNTTSTKLKVGSSLKPFTLYEFRVSAVNLLGKSPESKPLIVRTAATSKFIMFYSLSFLFISLILLDSRVIVFYLFPNSNIL